MVEIKVKQQINLKLTVKLNKSWTKCLQTLKEMISKMLYHMREFFNRTYDFLKVRKRPKIMNVRVGMWIQELKKKLKNNDDVRKDPPLDVVNTNKINFAWWIKHDKSLCNDGAENLVQEQKDDDMKICSGNMKWFK